MSKSSFRPPGGTDNSTVRSYSHFEGFWGGCLSLWCYLMHQISELPIWKWFGSLRDMPWSDIFDIVCLIVTLAWMYGKYYVWLIVTKATIGVVYSSVIRDGLVTLIPSLGLRLSRLPGLSFLADYKVTCKLDLATIFSLILLLAVLLLWHRALKLFCYGRDNKSAKSLKSSGDGDEYQERQETLTILLGAILLVVDGSLFYIAMTFNSWRGTTFSFSALLATAGYMAIVVYISYATVQMEHKLKEFING